MFTFDFIKILRKAKLYGNTKCSIGLNVFYKNVIWSLKIILKFRKPLGTFNIFMEASKTFLIFQYRRGTTRWVVRVFLRKILGIKMLPGPWKKAIIDSSNYLIKMFENYFKQKKRNYFFANLIERARKYKSGDLIKGILKSRLKLFFKISKYLKISTGS